MGNNEILIGSYTRSNEESKGLNSLHHENQKLKMHSSTNREVNNPTYLLQDNDIVYTIESNADKSGGIAIYQYKDGKFTFLDKMINDFSGPCHIDLDKTKKYVVTSHYHAGKLELHEVKDGKIVGLKQVVDHKQYEDAINPTSHVHFAKFTADNRFIITCDLGLNRVVVYPFDDEKGEIKEAEMVFYQTKQGSGPRHFVFNAKEDKVYVLNELSGSLLTFSFKNGGLELLNEQFPEALKTHDKTGDGAAIRMHPNGKYLYTTLRSSLNLIICYRLDNEGIPQQFAEVSTRGEHPRDFNITKDGKFLFVANQNTNDIFTFEINKDGSLKDLNEKFEIPNPVCVAI